MNIKDSVTVIRGIGPRISAQLNALGVQSIRDLLFHTPKRYEDRSRLTPLAQLTKADQWALVRCRILEVSAKAIRRRNFSVVQARLQDSSGAFNAVWFNQRWILRRFEAGTEVFLYGAVRTSKSGLQLVNPEIEEICNEREAVGIVPVYSSLGPLSERRLRIVIAQCASALKSLVDPLPQYLLDRQGLMGLSEALHTIHHPPSDDEHGSLESAKTAYCI